MSEDPQKERDRQIAEFIGNLAKLDDGDRLPQPDQRVRCGT